MNKFKKCKCPIEYWEKIVADNNKVYHHCDYCGEDWAITDFNTKKIIWKKEKK